MWTPRRLLGAAGACAAMTPFALIGCVAFAQNKQNPILHINAGGGRDIALASTPPVVYAYLRTPSIFYNSGGIYRGIMLTNPGKLALSVTFRLVPQCMAVFCASIYMSLFYKHALRWPLQNFERRQETHMFGQPLVKQKEGEEVYWPRYVCFTDGLLQHAGFVGMLAVTAMAAMVISAPVTVPCGWVWLRVAIALLRRSP